MIVEGLGYCLMGFWAIVRMALMCILNSQYLKMIAEDYLAKEEPIPGFDLKLFYAFSIVFLMVLASIDAGLRLFVGLSARADAKGKKKKNAYIVWLIIFILFDLISIGSTIISLGMEVTTELMDFIGTFLMIIMELVISADLLVASLYVRKYRKLEKTGQLIEPVSQNDNKETE